MTSTPRDLTAIIELPNLQPETKYYYRPVINGVPSVAAVQSFTTFPVAGAARDFSFAVLADLENAGSHPLWPAPAYESVAANAPAFVMQIGDFDHRNPTSLSQMRNMHRQIRNSMSAAGADFAQNIAPNFPFFHVWDDHDYGINDGDKTFAGRAAALQAFAEYYPTPDRPNPAGIWHSFDYAQAEFFMLDVRSQADPRLDPDGPQKSMLDGNNIPNGQLDWLKQGLLASTATWKFLVSGVTFNPGTKPYDAWGGYGRERQELLDFVNANAITGVVVISGDLHTGGAIDDGTNAGLPEVSVPHTNLPVDLPSSGIIGTWSEGFVSGIGGDGYTLITVDAGGLLLENRAANGAVRQQMFLETPVPAATLVSIAPASATNTEGNVGTTSLTFTVTRSRDISGTTTVNYSVTGSGMAPADAADFGGILPSGTVEFAPEQTSRTITVSVRGDTVFEPDESFTVTLSNPSSGVQITTASALGTIQNDDSPPVANGLFGEYFNGTNLTGSAGTRVDPVVNFPQDWGSAPAGTAVTPDDNYSVRWSGFVETSTAGNWTFYTTSNDGVRLWIDGAPIINNWTQHAVVQNSASVSLAAGWHAIRLEYFQQGGVAEITLSYQGPGQTKTIIPQSKLRTTNPGTTSQGLFGAYFNGTNLTGSAGTRVDPVVNFPQDWGSAPPGTAVTPDDNYSVRWSGFVETSTVGNWTFYTTSNDGVRLWIDGAQIINNWTQHAVIQNSATIALAAGWHAIQLEYFQQGGVAEITLSYQGPGQTKTIIPQSKLRTSEPGGIPQAVAPLPGDYDGNDLVDQTDYDVWRQSFGSIGFGLAADGNGNGAVDAADYIVWKKYVGSSRLTPIGTTVTTISQAAIMPAEPVSAASRVATSDTAIDPFPASSFQPNSLATKPLIGIFRSNTLQAGSAEARSQALELLAVAGDRHETPADRAGAVATDDDNDFALPDETNPDNAAWDAAFETFEAVF